MMECLNHYSNVLIALAAIASAVFAGVIWYETKKYRQITGELKELNKKIVEREQPNIFVTVPLHKKRCFSGNAINFVAPLWIVNRSSNPDLILSLEVKQNEDSVSVYKTCKNYEPTDELNLPLREPIILGPTTSKLLYIQCNLNPIDSENHYGTLEIRISFTGIDQKIQTQDFRFKVEFKGDSFLFDRLEENNTV